MKERENPGAARVKADAFSGSLDNASTACILSGKSSKTLLDGSAGGAGATPRMPRPSHALRTPPHAVRTPSARPLRALGAPSARPRRALSLHALLTAALTPAGGGKKAGARSSEGVFEESSGRGKSDAGQRMEASEARQAYEGLDTGGIKWAQGKEKSKEGGAASASDPALCARVDKLVSEQHNLVSEVANLRSGIASIEQLLRQGLPLPGAAAPQGRAALQPRRLSAAGDSEQSTRQLLAAAAGTSSAGGVPPPLQAAALPAVATCAPAAVGARSGVRPLNNLEA